jgi:hypothetical protein
LKSLISKGFNIPDFSTIIILKGCDIFSIN